MRIYAKELLEGLKKVKRTKMATLPILNYVMLKVEGHKTSLLTTDLENTLLSECESFTDDSFSVCVPMVSKYDGSNTYVPHWYKAYPFLELIKIHAEYGDLLEITYLQNVCSIKIQVVNEKNTSTLKCMDAEEFPAIAYSLVQK